MQIRRHARQRQSPAPDPIARRPPVECETCRYDKSSNAESEQVRKIQRRERQESRSPPYDSALPQPAQPESEPEKTNRETQIEIQEPLKKKYVGSDQQRPQRGGLFARIHLPEKKPGCRGQ